MTEAGHWSPGQPSLAKRSLDICLALVTLLLFSPVMALAAILVRMSGAGPVLLRQTRVGRHERRFEMLKFRTMHANADDRAMRAMIARELSGDRSVGGSEGVFKLKDDPRITPVGRWLRRLSIDELPQLLNVLRGDMSMVGPRPSLPWEVEMFTPEQRRRHECLPGITGLWQVSGRSRLSTPEMLELDLVYLREQSLRLDLRILLRTPTAVLFDRSV
ncbi:sugar transferase [Rhodovastum atsumiense]|uniref:Sugar transferase n=2 Tax=Rhodovastum atsumiense TaxID=504468 RepID=A0A5M6IKJ0_9PROT|nr:sugar transferase [Rhodovastum atsumiense]